MDRVRKAQGQDVQMKDVKAEAERKDKEVFDLLDKIVASVKKSKRFFICISVMDEKEDEKGDLKYQSYYNRYRSTLEDAKQAMREFNSMFDNDLRK